LQSENQVADEAPATTIVGSPNLINEDIHRANIVARSGGQGRSGVAGFSTAPHHDEKELVPNSTIKWFPVA
jgi:hypothetical protein